MKKLLLIGVAVWLGLFAANAQQRLSCQRPQHAAGTRSIMADYIPTPMGQVHIPVILAAYPDQAFSLPDADIRAYWHNLLNQPGYAEHGAQGSAADYFRQQSGGLFTPVFDVIGPVMLPQERAFYGANRSSVEGNDEKASVMIYDACVAANISFEPYSWQQNNIVDAVMVIYAGPGENRGGTPECIWPHMSSLAVQVGTMRLTNYACVSELRDRSNLDGYGTFLHEFSHCLALPDLYPVGVPSVYSLFDEWDLMDGGNYTNNGFSPPNYSAFERWLCGWYEPTELTVPATIAGMPAWNDEPVAYVVRHPERAATDYYVMENRQQRGFDSYVPGHGLLITHVTGYRKGEINPNDDRTTCVQLVYADNRTYKQCEAYYGTHYTADGRSNYLSGSAYPYVNGSTVTDAFTPTSMPTMAFDKPLTNICLAADGTISFDFMGGTSGIRPVTTTAAGDDGWYDLMGRRLPQAPTQKGVYIHHKKKVAF